MKYFLFLTVVTTTLFINAQNEIKMTWESEIKEVEYQNKKQFVISPNALYKDNWHNLPQTQFWKLIKDISNKYKVNIIYNSPKKNEEIQN